MRADPILPTNLLAARGRSGEPSTRAELVQRTFRAVEPHLEGLSSSFFGHLFDIAPETRELFPVNLHHERSRLPRALLHIVQSVDRIDQLQPFLEQLGRDHRKFGLLGWHVEALGTALLAAVRELAGEAWTEDVERAWAEAFGIVAECVQTAITAATTEPAVYHAQVVEHERIGWDVARIRVRTDERLPYQAGQYVSVEIPQRPRLWRYLSPANAPAPDGVVEFHVRSVPGGWVSRAMVAHSRVGDIWRLGAPLGRLHQSNTAQNVLMVAGGTGVAPIKAMLEELARRGRPPRTHVFFGGRTWDDLYCLPVLRAMADDQPWLDVTPVVERPDGRPGAEIGTLADVVSRYGAWLDHDVIVSGSPAMIRTTVTALLVAGTPMDRISYDPFAVE